MTKLLPYATIQNTGGDGPGAPGAAPLGTGAMQGNPASSQYTPNGNYPPGPQVGGAGQTINSPLVNQHMSIGSVPLNSVPANTVLAQPGTISLLSLISSGQASLNQSTYGQGAFVPRDSGPQVQQSAMPVPQSINPPAVLVVSNFVGD